MYTLQFNFILKVIMYNDLGLWKVKLNQSNKIKLQHNYISYKLFLYKKVLLFIIIYINHGNKKIQESKLFILRQVFYLHWLILLCQNWSATKQMDPATQRKTAMRLLPQN